MRSAAKEVLTTNGQEMPGVVLDDGTYVNGNRRDTALEFLTQDALKGKRHKRSGAKTSNFSWRISFATEGSRLEINTFFIFLISLLLFQNQY